MSIWQLPVEKEIGGKVYTLATDFRKILQIFQVLEDPDLPEPVRWLVALQQFYSDTVPRQHRREAMEYLCFFLRGGAPEAKGGVKLMDWQQDADAIIAGVNKAAGQEVRQLPFVHWWTFLSWFHAIGEGQLCTIVSIRDKLRRGKKLDTWEQEFYKENRQRIQLKKPLSRQELEERQRLEALLGK